jgi:Tol biopolymer transport system component
MRRARPDSRQRTIVALITSAIAISALLHGRISSVADEPALLFELTGSLHDPALSPDGRRIAFAWSQPGKPAEIHVRDLTDGSLAGITNGDTAARMPRWSPDGSKLAFLRDGRVWIATLGTSADSAIDVRGTAGLCCDSFVAGLDWSPDGRWLTYVGGSGTETHIAVMPVDGGVAIPVTNHRGGEWFPRWSPDSKRIAFYSTWDGDMTDIWTIAADGTSLSRLTHHPAEDFRPSFSPDGTWVVFTSRRGGKNDLWAVPSAGGEAVQLTDGHGLPLDAHWDRRRAVVGYYGSHPHLWSVDVNGGARTQLTFGTADDRTPAASPTGPLVALSSNRFSREAGIIQLNPSTSAVTPLLADDALRRFPAWSPDGRRLSFMQAAGGYLDSSQLWTSAADGTRRRLLATVTGVGRSVWAPDGSLVVFAASGRLWRVRAAGGEPVAIDGLPPGVTPSDARKPDRIVLGDGTSTFEYGLGDGALRTLALPGGAEGARWSRDGKQVAFLRSNGRHRDLYLAPADGTRPKRLTTDLHVQDWPTWSHDSKSIIVSVDNGTWKIAQLPDAAFSHLGTSLDAAAAAIYRGRPDRAAGMLQARLRTAASDGLAWFYLGLARRDSKDIPGAVDAMTRAASLGVGVMYARVQNARLLAARGEIDAAIRWLERAADAGYGDTQAVLTDDALSAVRSAPSFAAVLQRVRDNAQPEACRPAWSPDGRRIAFDSTRSGLSQLYLVESSGGEPVRLVTEEWSGHPAWSPDGSQLAFSSGRPGERSIVVMRADGAMRRIVASGPGNRHYPAWSPRGDAIAFNSDQDGDREIFVVDADGRSGARQVTHNTAHDDLPDWLDDQTLVFDSNRDGDWALFGMRRDGTHEHRLGTGAAPSFDSARRLMAFQDGPAGANSVHLWDLKRGTRRRVGPSANDYVPSLSPDGTRIAFCSRESGTPQIHVMNADGSGRRAVTGRGRSVGVPGK